MQMLLNELFAMTSVGGRCTLDDYPLAFDNVVNRQAMGYLEQLNNLPSKQKQLLSAISKEGWVKGITSSAFIKKYKLPSASSVQAALKPLLKLDIVTNDNGQYRIYDFFFSQWLKANF